MDDPPIESSWAPQLAKPRRDFHQVQATPSKVLTVTIGSIGDEFEVRAVAVHGITQGLGQWHVVETRFDVLNELSH